MIIEPEIWMISLLGNPKMTEIRNKSLGLLKKQGLKINLFPAITPDLIPTIKPQLNFTTKQLRINKGIPVPFHETEKALFYSHYVLWEKSYKENKSLMILEEDATLIKNIPKNWNIKRISILGPGSIAYIITPIKAKAMCDDIQKNSIKAQCDGFLYKHTFLKNNGKKYIIPSDDPGDTFFIQEKRNWSSMIHTKL